MELVFKKEVFEIIGAAMEVHSQLGSGFLESVYHEAMKIELSKRKIPFGSEVRLEVIYKGIPLKKFFTADLVCYDCIIIELKAAVSLMPEHEAQTLNYLKATGMKLALLINFGEKSLRYKRLVM